jgi:UDP-N-acetylglucosamine 2-epimerase (non-hydrolysing)
MRNTTERPEGVDSGFATIAGQSTEMIEVAVRKWLDNPELRSTLKSKINPYGDGAASQRIVKELKIRSQA